MLECSPGGAGALGVGGTAAGKEAGADCDAWESDTDIACKLSIRDALHQCLGVMHSCIYQYGPIYCLPAIHSE